MGTMTTTTASTLQHLPKLVSSRTVRFDFTACPTVNVICELPYKVKNAQEYREAFKAAGATFFPNSCTWKIRLDRSEGAGRYDDFAKTLSDLGCIRGVEPAVPYIPLAGVIDSWMEYGKTKNVKDWGGLRIILRVPYGFNNSLKGMGAKWNPNPSCWSMSIRPTDEEIRKIDDNRWFVGFDIGDLSGGAGYTRPTLVPWELIDASAQRPLPAYTTTDFFLKRNGSVCAFHVYKRHTITNGIEGLFPAECVFWKFAGSNHGGQSTAVCAREAWDVLIQRGYTVNG